MTIPARWNRRVGNLARAWCATVWCMTALLLVPRAWAVDKIETAPADSWPTVRGGPLSTGVSASTLPDKLDVLWKFSLPGQTIDATAVIDQGAVFVGDGEGNFFAVELKTGKEKWRFTAKESQFLAAAAVRNGLVHVGDVNGVFYCFDAETGQRKWTFNEANSQIDNGANYHKDYVLFGSQNSTLYCLHAATGKLAWKYAIEDQIRCSPTIVGERVFLAGCDGKLHILDVNKGEPLGSVEIEAPTGSTPAAVGDMVYFGTEGENFLAIDWKAAKVEWKYRHPTKNFPFRAAAALTSDMIIVAGHDKLVRGLHPATGEQKWEFATRGRVDSSPVVVGSQAYFGTADGKLVGLRVGSGEKAFEFETGGSFTASPAVAAGRLVIGNTDGTLYCFGAK